MQLGRAAEYPVQQLPAALTLALLVLTCSNLASRGLLMKVVAAERVF